eukprot:TRINITY_DN15613_c0_g2_i1.p1 TRINITY_DN15613_c0_g2~~TRINITY_DN15613_c0_g2_i1.p1  ORF type:complete len:346 (-),score=60.97 TRINITY_DN15613_c0_g2_i1:188-1171(-)
MDDLSAAFSRLSYEKRHSSFMSTESKLNQKRREERLRMQKESRFNFQKYVRSLYSDDIHVQPTLGDSTYQHSSIFTESLVEPVKPVVSTVDVDSLIVQNTLTTNQLTPGKNRKRKVDEIGPALTRKQLLEEKLRMKYKDSLMIPEALVEPPEDLKDNWICVPYPISRRVCVSCYQNKTTLRLRNGVLLATFKSNLPGGGKKRSSNKEYCVLDCLLDETTSKIYVLDLMVWKGNQYYDCDAEFRSFWVFQKFQELSEGDISEQSNDGYSFKLLERHDSDLSLLSKMLKEKCFSFGVPAGFFFYHKEGNYWPGASPLMGFMTPDQITEF